MQQAIADKWYQKGPTVVAFDDKLQYYYKTIDEVETLPLVKDQDCIRLHMGPLASSVKEHAKQWIGHLGKILRDSAKESLYKLRDQLDVSVKLFYEKYLNDTINYQQSKLHSLHCFILLL